MRRSRWGARSIRLAPVVPETIASTHGRFVAATTSVHTRPSNAAEPMGLCAVRDPAARRSSSARRGWRVLPDPALTPRRGVSAEQKFAAASSYGGCGVSTRHRRRSLRPRRRCWRARGCPAEGGSARRARCSVSSAPTNYASRVRAVSDGGRGLIRRSPRAVRNRQFRTLPTRCCARALRVRGLQRARGRASKSWRKLPIRDIAGWTSDAHDLVMWLSGVRRPACGDRSHRRVVCSGYPGALACGRAETLVLSALVMSTRAVRAR